MSVLRLEADIHQGEGYVSLVPKPEVRIIRPPRRLGALEYLVHQLGDVGARNVEAGDSSHLCFRLLCGLGDHTPIVNLVSDPAFPVGANPARPSAWLKGANTGSPAASLWKSCFAEAVDKYLSLSLTATS
jgi:hypothetical protein